MKPKLTPKQYEILTEMIEGPSFLYCHGKYGWWMPWSTKVDNLTASGLVSMHCVAWSQTLNTYLPTDLGRELVADRNLWSSVVKTENW